MFAVGRVLQMMGMAILPIAMLMELQHQISLWQMLGFSAFGVLLFLTGYTLLGYSQGSE